MNRPDPQFGVRRRGVAYLERPGAYAIICGTRGKLAFVRGEAGRLFLPGGGVQPGEQPEDALLREIVEELGWRARLIDIVGRATQFLAVEGEGCFAIRATYFRARLIAQATLRCEHEIVWLPAAIAATLLARESDAWAISRACERDAILR
jgi:8-oxo-dGTP diphosphatase